MKKILSVIIALMLVTICTGAAASSDAEFLGREAGITLYINGEAIGEVTNVYGASNVPLAKAMTALGYAVSFDADSSIVCAQKDAVSYYFDIPNALVWAYANDKKEDICLNANPVIVNGVTYVSPDFFYDELSLYYTVDYSNGNKYLYDLEIPSMKVRDVYKKILDQYKENGYDINQPQEYSLGIDFSTEVKCAPLGISLTGGGDFEMSAYTDLANKTVSYSYDGNVSEIFNIYKLINGEPLDEAKRINGSVYMDKDAVYSKSDLLYNAYSGMADGKWVKTALPATDADVFDYENTQMYKGILRSLLSVADVQSTDVIPFCDSVAKCFERLFECASISSENGKLVITSKITTKDVSDIIMEIYSNYAIGYYSGTREFKIENQVQFFNKLFETANINVDEKSIMSGGKIESQTSTFNIDFVYTVPQVNLPITFKINGNAKADGLQEVSVLKQPPALEDVFDIDAYINNIYASY